MISIKVSKLEMTGYSCDNPNCKHLPEYHFNIIGNNYHIKTGTVCAWIGFSNGTLEIYCADCIDEVYKLCKLKLNKALWAFH